MDCSRCSHHRQSKTETMKVIEAILNMVQMVKEKMINPFTYNTNSSLVNIATDEKASSNDVLFAFSKGKTVIVDAASKNLNKINIIKLKPFNFQLKTNKTKQIIYHDETTVTRALCFIKDADTKTRREAFSHECTNYPSSLFEPDESGGFSMRKGQKSDFVNALVNAAGGDIHEPLPNGISGSFITDSMAFIQKYQQLNSKTIKELCFKLYAKMIAIKPGGCKMIHIVGDRYDVPDDQSLKADERKRRTGSKKLQEYVLSSNLDIPEWSPLIRNHKNKAHLLNFLSSYYIWWNF